MRINDSIKYGFSPVTYCITYKIRIMAYVYLYFKQICIPKMLLITAILWRRVSKIYKICLRCHYSINKNKVILCDNTPFCDEEQTELLRVSPNFDGNVGID